jgi:hypothetical protein
MQMSSVEKKALLFLFSAATGLLEHFNLGLYLVWPCLSFLLRQPIPTTRTKKTTKKKEKEKSLYLASVLPKLSPRRSAKNIAFALRRLRMFLVEGGAQAAFDGMRFA